MTIILQITQSLIILMMVMSRIKLL